MSTELVVGIGSRESPDHMTSPTSHCCEPYSRSEGYELKERVAARFSGGAQRRPLQLGLR